MLMKRLLVVSSLAMMSAYALGQSHTTTPWSLDRPAPAAPLAPAPQELKGLLERSAPVPAAGRAETPIDLTALRYFVSRNDLKRAAAEIRLIRVKHPTWSPPEDLFNDSGATIDETPMWRLYEKADFEGARALIAERQEQDPAWRPSADFANKLTLGEAVKSLKEASEAQNWEETIRVASANKMLLTCDYVDVLWRVAEALSHSQDNERALAAYKYVLQNCDKAADRKATVEKAMALFGPGAEIDELVTLARRSPDGRNEFEFVKWDRLRAQMGKAIADATAPRPSEADVHALTAHISNGPDRRNDQKLLGWWWYGQKDYAQAEAFFRKANQGAPDPKAAEGLVLTLTAENKLPEALTLANQYAGLGPNNRAAWASLQLAILLADDKANVTPEDETALISALAETKDAQGAQALGWRFYRGARFARARELFENSLNWQANEPAAVGLATSLRQLGDSRAYAAALAKYSSVYAKVAELNRMAYRPVARAAPVRKMAAATHARPRVKKGGGGWDKEADAIVNQVRAGLVPEALQKLEMRRAQGRKEPAGLSIVRGWALYNAGRFEEAGTAFHTAYNAGLKSDAEKGLSRLGFYKGVIQ